MNDDISPDIAALLASTSFDSDDDFPVIEEDHTVIPSGIRKSTNVSQLQAAPRKRLPSEPVDLTIKSFEKITKFFSDIPNHVFSDPNYYKAALSGENESSQRLHNLLSKYLSCQDPKDRTVYRQQMVNVYWEFIKSIAPKMTNTSTHLAKKMAMRFGVVLPTLFTAEQKDLFSSVFVENESGEPVYYLDEWFKDIGAGRLSISATDEARPQKKAGTPGEEANRLQILQSKNNGKLQTAENMLLSKEGERAMVEAELKSRIEILCDHPVVPGLEPHKSAYSESQKKLLGEINERLKTLLKLDKEINASINEFREAKEIDNSLRDKIASAGGIAEVSSSDLLTELDTVRQMAKMTVGRQGNHFPLFTREFFHCLPRQTGFRENIIDVLDWVESVDPGAFCRIHKNVSNRIVPFVLLIPTYGDTGFCWEPFDRYNRVTSRGRIVVPMYPKNLQIAVLTAVADLRWQVAKEKASYYWMEEGLTGQYYQWISAQKLKGDLKSFFINDYVLWMTKESEGVQRLDKEVRAIFWRHIPFAQEIKEKLKTRSLIYQELYQRDVNRSMSDGY